MARGDISSRQENLRRSMEEAHVYLGIAMHGVPPSNRITAPLVMAAYHDQQQCSHCFDCDS